MPGLFYLLSPPADGTFLQEEGFERGSLLVGEDVADEGGWRRSSVSMA